MNGIMARALPVIRPLVVAFVLMFAPAVPAFASDFLTGYDAYQRGDFAEALKFYRKAAEAGDAVSQVQLGGMYKEGVGVDKDPAEAVKWYRKAADQGSAGGQISLGVMYDFGYGVRQDYAEAVKWYRKAADQGDATGQFELGLVYELGHGVPKDLGMALALYRKSAEQGNSFGKEYLAKLEAKGVTTAASAPAVPEPVVAPPPADRRVALVIGNSAYKNAALANPAIDADIVGASLTRAGFEVTVVKDADFAAFDAALTSFADKAQGADIALFYFAGHGFAVNDGLRARNYLMSTSADLRAVSDSVLRRDGLPLDDVIARIAQSPKVTLAFVDACRNDPFHRGGGDRGFARIKVDVRRQLYVGMSTTLGQTALDGDEGKGSPFALAFAETMSTPGLRVDDAFRHLRQAVASKTEGKQTPEILQDDLNEGSLVLVHR